MRYLIGRLSFALVLILCSIVDADPLGEALALVEQREYDEAIEQLEAVLPKLRKTSERNLVRYTLGQTYQTKKRWEDAIKVYEAALANKIEVEAHTQWHLAECYEALEDDANAAIWYRQLIRLHPAYPRASDARYRLAKAELALTNYSAVLATYAQAKMERYGQYLCAQAHEGLQNWPEAYRAYQDLIQANPSDEVAQDAYERLLIVLSQADGIHPSRTERLKHAEVLLGTRQRTEARKILSKIVGKNTDKLAGQATYLIGQSFAAQHKYDDAIREYAKIRDQYSASGYLTRALYQSALLHRKKGEITKGNQLLMEFVATYAWSALADNALYEVGKTEQGREKYEEAISAYQKLLEQYTRSSLVDDTLWNMGWCHLKLGKLEKAQEVFRELHRRFSGSDMGNAAQYWIAKLYERRGQTDQAAEAYMQILKEEDWYYAHRAELRLGQLIEDGKLDSAVPERRFPIGETPPKWQDIQNSPLPQLDFLLRAHAYADAVSDLGAALATAKEQRPSVYYYLILCSEKMQKYRQASLYAYRLSRLDGWRDAQGRLPEPLFSRMYPLYYRHLIDDHAAKSELDPMFVAAMIREESRYQVDIVSRVGAVGLMQLMPPTAKDIASRLKIRNFRLSMLSEPTTSIQFGSWYMGQLMKQFQSPELVSGAYNGGPGRMERWTKERPPTDMDEFIEDVPITETRNHIKRVMHSYSVYRQVYATGDAL